jgi:hypothetical protein
MCWPRGHQQRVHRYYSTCNKTNPLSLLEIVKRTLFGPPNQRLLLDPQLEREEEEVVEWDIDGSYDPPTFLGALDFSEERQRVNMLLHDSVISKYLIEPAVLQLVDPGPDS